MQDIDWILQKEGGETTLLKRDPASGGRGDTWYIREGNHITLAELFNQGCVACVYIGGTMVLRN